MKRLAGSSIVVLALSLTACGAKTQQVLSSPQGKAETAKAEQVYKQCGSPSPFTLANKAAAEKFGQCAVPPGQRLKFRRCLISGLTQGVPTKSKAEQTVLACIGKVN